MEAAFNGRDHQITDYLAGYAGIGDGRPRDNLLVTGVDDEDDADHRVITGMNIEII